MSEKDYEYRRSLRSQNQKFLVIEIFKTEFTFWVTRQYLTFFVHLPFSPRLLRHSCKERTRSSSKAISDWEKDSAVIKRNAAVCEIAGLGVDDEARKLWKRLKGYHKRSLGETAMYRIKQLTVSNL